jgi:hypothetical protein
MAGLMRDVHPILADIEDGKHDDLLGKIALAVERRQKRVVRTLGLRPNVRFRITDAAHAQAPDFAGREGKVIRVNAKTVTVKLDKLDDHDYRTEWRVPHAWVEAI